jgi:hypothetical protein
MNMSPSAPSGLPQDFGQTLQSVLDLGITDEQPSNIDIRLTEAIRDAAVRSNQKPADAGFSDWVKSVAEESKTAVHAQICATDGSGLKGQYSDLLDKGLTTDGISAISSVIVQIINPTFAISSVLIYLSVWLLKFGLDSWCKMPAK